MHLLSNKILTILSDGTQLLKKYAKAHAVTTDTMKHPVYLRLYVTLSDENVK
jgi:hypothetical protein